MTATTSESSLVEQVRSGSEDALLVLHARYASRVYSVAYRVLNDQMAAEEVTQDTFMRLWRKADSYDPARGSFGAWLLTIARRLAIDSFRHQKRDPMLDAQMIGEDTGQWEPAPEGGGRGDLRRTLALTVQTLPDEQRQAIELAYFYGMSHSEIADYLDVPLGTIKTRIRLGMERLRTAWAGEKPAHPKGRDST